MLLAYRLPRLPSTPRSTVWRKLQRLGVVQVADGVVALPADARTREALEWLAEEVLEHDGDATVWLGRPADKASQQALATRMTVAVDAEYDAVLAEAEQLASGGPQADGRGAARLRRELHRIQARDFFSSTRRDVAERAVAALATTDVEPVSRGSGRLAPVCTSTGPPAPG